MDLIVERVDVWAASVQDKPGGLAVILGGLEEAGADLDFVIARRSPEKPGTGAVFVTPLRGDREVEAATVLGFNVTNSIKAVRVEGENIPGAGAKLTKMLGEAGLNMRGLSASVIGAKFICYIGFDTSEDAAEAMSILKSA